MMATVGNLLKYAKPEITFLHAKNNICLVNIKQGCQ